MRTREGGLLERGLQSFIFSVLVAHPLSSQNATVWAPHLNFESCLVHRSSPPTRPLAMGMQKGKERHVLLSASSVLRAPGIGLKGEWSWLP